MSEELHWGFYMSENAPRDREAEESDTNPIAEDKDKESESREGEERESNEGEESDSSEGEIADPSFYSLPILTYRGMWKSQGHIEDRNPLYFRGKVSRFELFDFDEGEKCYYTRLPDGRPVLFPGRQSAEFFVMNYQHMEIPPKQ